MKTLFFSLTLVGATLLASCGGSDSQKMLDENAQLRNERDSLMASASGPYQINLAPMDTAALRAAILALKNAPTIKIPSSMTFEKDTLIAILNASSQGKQTKGIMAYPILMNGIVKVALIPYYETAPGDPVHYELAHLKAYDYSQICPNVCASNASTFGAENVFLTFKK